MVKNLILFFLNLFVFLVKLGRVIIYFIRYSPSWLLEWIKGR